jgi:hypothetical protein
MKDLLLEDNGLKVDAMNHDLVIGESSRQHQELLLLTNKGEWREHPLIGVGLETYLNGENGGDLFATVKKQFSDDGMLVSDIVYEDGKLKINAEYEES